MADLTSSPEYLAADSSGKLYRVAIGFAIVETAVVLLFLYARMKIKTANGLDFYLVLPSYVVCFSLCIMCFLYIKYGGMGHHIIAVPYPQIVTFLKLDVALSNISALAMSLPKLAILALYLRVFSTPLYRYIIFSLVGVLILMWIIFLGLNMGMCVPFAYQWDKLIPNGHCLNQFAIFTWFRIPHIIINLIMIILPMPIIWGLKTTRAQRVGLTLTFLTGGIGNVAAIITFVVFTRLKNPQQDLTWIGVDVVMWTVIEPGVYLMAACLPSLRVLLQPVVEDVDLNALFHLGDETNRVIITAGEVKNIHLSSLSAVHDDASGSTDQRSSRSSRGFKKIEESRWPTKAFMDGNKKSGMATHFRDTDSEEEARKSNETFNGIVVQKGFAIMTEPVK